MSLNLKQVFTSHHNGSSIICNNVIMDISLQIEVVVSGMCLNITIAQHYYMTLYTGISLSPQKNTFSPLNSSFLILHWTVSLESGHCHITIILLSCCLG